MEDLRSNSALGGAAFWKTMEKQENEKWVNSAPEWNNLVAV